MPAQCAGLQFGIRTLLATTAFVAVAVWSWPAGFQGYAVFLFGSLPAFVFLSFFFAPSAWQSFGGPGGASSRPSQSRLRERISLAAALVAITPAMMMWIAFTLEPYEYRHPYVHSAMDILVYAAAVLCVGSILFIITSLAIFPAARQNFPLLAWRCVALIFNLIWPPVFYFTVLTKL